MQRRKRIAWASDGHGLDRQLSQLLRGEGFKGILRSEQVERAARRDQVIKHNSYQSGNDEGEKSGHRKIAIAHQLPRVGKHDGKRERIYMPTTARVRNRDDNTI